MVDPPTPAGARVAELVLASAGQPHDGAVGAPSTGVGGSAGGAALGGAAIGARREWGRFQPALDYEARAVVVVCHQSAAGSLGAVRVLELLCFACRRREKTPKVVELRLSKSVPLALGAIVATTTTRFLHLVDRGHTFK